MKALTKEQVIAERKRLLVLLKKEREKQEKNIYFVATRSGIQIPTLHDIEGGEKNVTLDSVIKVCNTLGLTIKFTEKLQ